MLKSVSALAGGRVARRRRFANLTYPWQQHFPAGTEGYVLMPGRLDTLFQDDAGSTPVTAVGQTVGAVLDVKHGLVPGAELVTNGDFSAGATGWTADPGWTISGGQASFSGGVAGNLLANVAVTAGRFYAVAVDVSGLTGLVDLRLGNGGVQVAVFPAGSSGRIVFRVAATSGIQFIIRGQAGATITIDNISVRELPGNHFTQATFGSRPAYQVDGSNLGHLLFDGVNDFMSSGTITPGSDKVCVVLGIRKLSDAAVGMALEASIGTGSGRWNMQAPPGAANPAYQIASNGTIGVPVPASGYPAPITNVVTGLADIASDSVILRVNGTQVASLAADQGTGNYLAYQHFMGMRNGTSLPLNGRIYGAFVRYGALPSASELAQIEAAMNTATGAF